MPAASTKTFDAIPERTGDRLNWVIIRLPFDSTRLWGKRGQLRVKGEINSFAFRTSLFPDGKGAHCMLVNKKMLAGGGAAVGRKARFRLEPDTTPREVAPPAELVRVLRESKRLQKYHASLSYSMRHEISKWIGGGKQSETRKRRAEQLAERLMLTMEAEHELPPVLQVAFAHNPKGRAGWQLMPPAARRGHLLGIFYYRNPKSRGRRVAKAVEEMVRYVEKRGRKEDDTD
ncbi:MAG TPA: YdeI/OmpD-associated family protein [Verrucomicrobiae bacterium]|jgi:uncharacterized protein YdeI (YjbR/CyaY-like superfamily)|nr:YdeI/OmpD-associated family protein [Verrucomicrobiae bacterium]